MASEQFSLCWDNFHRNMSSGMNSLLENEDLVDVTLAVEGRYLKAHKMVLSVCSPYFKDLFKTNPCQHPIVFMKDVSYVALSDLLQFMYQGEVQVSQENLSTFIKTAEALQIKGLTGDGSGTNENDVDPPKQSSQIVSDYKTSVTSPIPSRTKKVPANSSYSAPIPKRQRVSTGPSSVTSGPDVQIVNSPITKTEPIEHKSNTDMVQFKMEPYDSTQSIKISDIDDTFEEGFEETGVDDAEDYTMMEGGEEEPQAGTSTEGTGEGQGTIYITSGLRLPNIIFENNKFGKYYQTKQETRWRCNFFVKTKCKAKLLTTGKSVFVAKIHNHAPTVGYDEIKYAKSQVVHVYRKP